MNEIQIYTDGACSGNPGPAGIGIVLIQGNSRKEISKFIGENQTNNIAELTAIYMALWLIKDSHKKTPIKIYSDSEYSINVITGKYKAKKNPELIKKIQDLMKQFDNIEFIKVKGHSTDPNNNKADQLAVEAIKKR